ncbi:30S ribosomal protein S4 [Candidatus Similichlamydia laticola]|uniref:Small ribosomal subunit protein uS4 n=1 Tax=Candidatus Similichlamydia laticola TaxID=2170265 RepID=A0A369KF09_9BACT|nr:30S ribosomal protein S4 [Candidatus Similichlamydia laticola]RDB31285.1 SSU ribosomal protein S4p (S9e) [Candidatus Similichlamydia laticola]
MARYRGSKNKIARRFGSNVFGRQRNPLVHKQNPPGQHGARRRKKSDYGIQLEEKQKLKAAFGMVSEKHLGHYFDHARALAARKGGSVADHLLCLLECRLDMIVFRLKFVTTPFAAQQAVAHGHVFVNGRRVDIRSFQVRPGMEISIRPSLQNETVKNAMSDKRREVPEYLELESDSFRGKLLSYPLAEQVPLPLEINISTVCEFLAHNG